MALSEESSASHGDRLLVLDEDGAEPGANDSRTFRQGQVHSRTEGEGEKPPRVERAADKPELVSALKPSDAVGAKKDDMATASLASI